MIRSASATSTGSPSAVSSAHRNSAADSDRAVDRARSGSAAEREPPPLPTQPPAPAPPTAPSGRARRPATARPLRPQMAVGPHRLLRIVTLVTGARRAGRAAPSPAASRPAGRAATPTPRRTDARQPPCSRRWTVSTSQHRAIATPPATSASAVARSHHTHRGRTRRRATPPLPPDRQSANDARRPRRRQPDAHAVDQRQPDVTPGTTPNAPQPSARPRCGRDVVPSPPSLARAVVGHTGAVLFVELAAPRVPSPPPRNAARRSPRWPTCCAMPRPTRSQPAVAFATGATLQGRIGVGWATLSDVRPDPAPTHAHGRRRARRDRRTGAIGGGGSVARRRDVLHDLLSRATEPEQQHDPRDPRRRAPPGRARRRDGGRCRQGGRRLAGRGPAGAMFAGSLSDGRPGRPHRRRAGLGGVQLTPTHPVQPMLASPATSVADALADTGLGFGRVEARRRPHPGPSRRTATSASTPATSTTSPIVWAVSSTSSRALPGGDLVLDGEVLGVDDAGTPRRFQDTMGDFGADAAGTGAGRGHGLQAFFFDVLHAGDEPSSTSRSRRDATSSPPPCPSVSRLPSIVTADADEAEQFLERAHRRRPRGRDGQGPRRRRTTPAAVAAPGARSSRSTRSTSS